MSRGDTVHVVYQMGKVGSSSLYESLRAAGVPNLYKIHYLSDQGIERAQRLYAGFRTEVGVPHLAASRELRELRRSRPDVRWTVFTLVREVIARDVSAYVQMVDLLNPALVDGPEPDVGRIARGAAAQFLGFDERRNYTCRWFADELGAVFGVDVFDHAFDHARGWQWIRTAGVDLILLRTEDLTRVLSEATTVAVDVPVAPVYASARSPEKLQAAYEVNTYRRVLDRVRIPERTCRRVYDAKYARHFYTDQEIDAFTDRWTKRQEG
ncbi:MULTISPECIES: putative capsular polysaccharide synthesis family protein [Actinoplanes]|uniref:putative capsular polysaccharide synthesis family protein n=1 Tax=Actinoplanes TaxID=1865 RepID=UPI0012F83BF9|nr:MULTISPECIES: putative capsular polysaccharide synthesis family protein [Actinoplanes]